MKESAVMTASRILVVEDDPDGRRSVIEAIRDAGYEVWYVPEARVIHYYRGMTVYTRKVVVWLHVGHALYADKHYRGVEWFLIKYLKYLGVVLRMIAYALAGCVTFRKALFSKAYYYGVALSTLLTRRIEYVRGYVGKVEPWTKYL